MNELLPCPFCGGHDTDPAFLRGYKKGDQSQPIIAAGCMECGATGAPVPVPDHSTGYEEAVEEWNRRHAPEGWQAVPVELIDWIRGAQRLMRALPDGGGWPAAADQADMLLAAAPKPGGDS